MRGIGWVVPLVAVLASGCYTYRAVPATTPVAGTLVALQLTDSGAVVLAREIGPAAEMIEGRLVAASESSLTLAVRTVRLRGGLSNQWAGERVTIARPLIAGVQERRLSRLRSVLFVTGIVAGAAFGATELSGWAGGSGRSGRGGAGER